MKYVAHIRKSDQSKQSLEDHLMNVSRLAGQNAEKFGLREVGELIGLLHDVGKYSADFQAYIKKVTSDQDCDDIDTLRGKIDHSTAGAQYVNKKFSDCIDTRINNVSKLISLCLASHHSGLIDCVSSSGDDLFRNRINKDRALTHCQEVFEKICVEIKQKIDDIIANNSLTENVIKKINDIIDNERNKYLKEKCILRAKFKIGLLARMLLSCLVDADHTDTADFESPVAARFRLHGKYESWESQSDKFENYLCELPKNIKASRKINKIRATISNEAQACGKCAQNGVFTLTVPTGGGKTLASLRFALARAKNTPKIERIIYVIPYTSIIDQNAEVARKIFGSSVIEHHSNLTEDKNTWRNKVLSENWDAPIVFTTMVQFCDTLFGAGTRDVRRMHKLANSVIVFDEIQTLPIRLVHMFCNTINFLADTCNSTIVLCTATQPLFEKVNAEKGNIPKIAEIAPNVKKLFDELKRVELVNLMKSKNQDWNCAEVAELAIEKQRECKSCLVVVNTTKTARIIYQQLQDLLKSGEVKLLHLSARMCATHRIDTLNAMKKLLDEGAPLICVSTQVIEAGVDVDFGTGVRSLAGLDSLAQTAGRVNRNGKSRNTAKLYLVNISNDEENVSRLADIKIGQQKTERILRETQSQNMFAPNVVELYYRYYFYERKDEMEYRISRKHFTRDDNLLNILSSNSLAVNDYMEKFNNTLPYGNALCQSFSSAAKLYRAIDSDTRGVLVEYGDKGKEIIAKLCSDLPESEFYKVLHEAQRYSVNVYSNSLDKIPVCETSEGSGILYVNEQYYSKDFGLCDEKVAKMKYLEC